MSWLTVDILCTQQFEGHIGQSEYSQIMSPKIVIAADLDFI